MKPHPTVQALAQRILNDQGATLLVDGNFGYASDRVADRIHGINLTPERQVALTVQKAWNRQREPHQELLKEDGWWGPATQHAAELMLGQTFQRPDENGKPAQQCHDGSCSAVRCWNPNDSQMQRYYGAPGTNQTTILLPFAVRLDWDMNTIVTKATVHQKCAPSFQAALEEIRDELGRDQIEALGLNRFGGTLNVRRKRGGSSWSTHAYGAAGDWWPSVNALRETHRTARFAREAYVPWFGIWERHGWMSLGRCYDFDWMHLQHNPPQ